ncbi:MAG: glycogen synthase GlgA [Pseudomonadota bacterium]
MRVLAVAPECFPYVKTGGLADVVGALPGALGALGHDVRTLVPGYPAVLAHLGEATVIDTYDELFGAPAAVWEVPGKDGAPSLLVVDARHLYDRPGHLYLASETDEWPDNPLRFAALAVVAREIALGRLPAWRPDVVHAHDWQSGLVPAYLALDGRPRPPCVMTVHNLAFQGQYDPAWFGALGLPADTFAPDGVEYYGGIGFLKAGLHYADRLTTVSPTYAREIQSMDWGMGLGGLLHARENKLVGIVNGIDDAVWNPSRDPWLDPTYTVRSIDRRATHKAAVQQAFGLHQQPDALLFCVISRLAWQKGIDTLLPAVGALVDAGCQLAVLGSGDPALEAGFHNAAAVYPGRVGVIVGYDEGMSHRLQAGADAIIVPSRFEPCGLTQLYGLRYGCLPIAARTGGLIDTVHDVDVAGEAAATGISFASGRTDSLIDAIERALTLWREPERWRQRQRRGMTKDLGWGKAASAYAAVYEAARADLTLR